MAVNSSANSVILILFAFSDNLSAENSKLSADSWNRGNHLLGCMLPLLVYPFSGINYQKSNQILILRHHFYSYHILEILAEMFISLTFIDLSSEQI